MPPKRKNPASLGIAKRPSVPRKRRRITKKKTVNAVSELAEGTPPGSPLNSAMDGQEGQQLRMTSVWTVLPIASSTRYSVDPRDPSPHPSAARIDKEEPSVIPVIGDDRVPTNQVSGSPKRDGVSNACYTTQRDKSSISGSTEPIVPVAGTVMNSLSPSSETPLGDRSVRIINRLSTANRLPTFSGDPLEWLHFKNMYESTTKSGGYSEQENVARLFEALKGEARKTVAMLLTVGKNADAILKTLERHFGNRKVIAERIMDEIRQLPVLESGCINLTQFSTKLQNAVTALRDLDLPGYLGSPELIKSVGRKLPAALKYAYSWFPSESTANASDIERLADYLAREAERADATGVFDSESAQLAPRTCAPPKPARKERVEAAYAITQGPSIAENVRSSRTVGLTCPYCHRKSHGLDTCYGYPREPSSRRWTIARQARLCFQCLKTGHPRLDCKAPRCATCNRRHHTLLHQDKDGEEITKHGSPLEDRGPPADTQEGLGVAAVVTNATA